MSVLNTLISILLLRAGPQDLPYSPRLLQVCMVLYVASGAIAFRSVLETDIAITNMLADLVVILLYTHLVLRSFGHRPRYIQTVTAMVGIGALFHLIAWPMMQQVEIVDGEQVISAAASLYMLMLISWSLMVNAHIFRQAMEFSLTSAILLSFSLFFISLAVSRYLLPQA